MILYEHEGKELFKKSGINIPKSVLLNSESNKTDISFPCVLKAQVLSGKRADKGGILIAYKENELKPALGKIFGLQINNEPVRSVLVEEKISFEKSFYLSLSYDTDYRSPVLAWSEDGGTGIEERKVNVLPFDILKKDLPDDTPFPKDLLEKIVKIFLDSDCLLLEINPLVLTKDKDGKEEWVALDAKINLDDTTFGRHKDWNYPSRESGRQPTEREIAAKLIDKDDHRGTAGSSFVDLPGDVAVLASGGGASLVAMDALIALGMKPANYTEYSGNPPREKVARLAEIVLSKSNIKGLWVVGAVANFTDIFETLSGVIEGIRSAEKNLGRKFDFPIVIRRGGPREKEALSMLKDIKDFNIKFYGRETTITESAKIMAEEANK